MGRRRKKNKTFEVFRLREMTRSIICSAYMPAIVVPTFGQKQAHTRPQFTTKCSKLQEVSLRVFCSLENNINKDRETSQLTKNALD